LGSSSTRIRLSARTLSALGSGLGLARWFPLEEEWVLEQAQNRTGLTDWGDDAFREPLGLLLAEARRVEPPLLGRIGMLETLLRAVANRMRVRDALRRDPEIAAIHVASPVFVIGLRGTGFRALHRLLASLPGLRGLRFWETLHPAPPLEGERDTRIRDARDLLRVGGWLAPELAAMDRMEPEAVDECWPLFFPTFQVPSVAVRNDVPAYAQWLWRQDARPAYRWLASALRLLLRQGPREQLVLAAPDHLWFLDALLEVFTDANVVWVHRDPAACVAVTARVATLTRRTVAGRADPTEVGPGVAERVALGLWRAMGTRRSGDTRFVDVAHADLVRDPVRVARAVAEGFELPWTDAHEKAARAWAAASGAIPVPTASPAEYAVDPEAWMERFSAYRERFGVPEEALAPK